jgi:hypothetical protein
VGGVKGHELSYCYILTGSRDGRRLKKEMDGTGKCENRGRAYLAIAEERKRGIDGDDWNEIGLVGGQSAKGQNERKGMKRFDEMWPHGRNA